ncbi:MAG: hypothetical protein F4X42_11835 [Rhodospirillaceae bacterium]|nr:hypothetical protein [Rhodospirillaceae bacterium]MYB13928.1 hypothetical protein [Rhodospirillaceae bacterium]
MAGSPHAEADQGFIDAIGETEAG